MFYTIVTSDTDNAVDYHPLEGESLLNLTRRVSLILNEVIAVTSVNDSVSLFVNDSGRIGHYQGKRNDPINYIVRDSADMIVNAYNAALMQDGHMFCVLGFTASLTLHSRHNVLSIHYGSYDASVTLWDTDSSELTDQSIRNLVQYVYAEHKTDTRITVLQSMFDSMVSMFTDSYINRLAFQGAITLYGVTMTVKQKFGYNEVNFVSATNKLKTDIYDGYDIESEINATLSNMLVCEG